MSDRFDLEQQILECWRVTDDIKLFAEQNPSNEKWQALKIYYDSKFEQLWTTFEVMCKERQFVTTTQKTTKNGKPD
jgi:hypothetical protein